MAVTTPPHELFFLTFEFAESIRHAIPVFEGEGFQVGPSPFADTLTVVVPTPMPRGRLGWSSDPATKISELLSAMAMKAKIQSMMS